MTGHGLTRLEAASLGLLVDRPDHPYALQARLAPGLPRAQRPNDGVIRPLLARLERRGLLTHDVVEAGGRSRKVFRATPDGERAFTAWLTAPTGDDEALGASFFLDQPFLRLLFDRHLTMTQRAAELDRIDREARARLDLLDRLPGLTDGSPVTRVLLDVARAREEAVRAGVERLRRTTR